MAPIAIVAPAKRKRMATQTTDLLFDIKDGIATLTMNRPEARNALSLDMM